MAQIYFIVRLNIHKTKCFESIFILLSFKNSSFVYSTLAILLSEMPESTLKVEMGFVFGKSQSTQMVKQMEK